MPAIPARCPRIQAALYVADAKPERAPQWAHIVVVLELVVMAAIVPAAGDAPPCEDGRSCVCPHRGGGGQTWTRTWTRRPILRLGGRSGGSPPRGPAAGSARTAPSSGKSSPERTGSPPFASSLNPDPRTGSRPRRTRWQTPPRRPRDAARPVARERPPPHSRPAPLVSCRRASGGRVGGGAPTGGEAGEGGGLLLERGPPFFSERPVFTAGTCCCQIGGGPCS